jgi:hypothetical protein
MINYLIKFDDLSLSTVRLFTYDEGNKNQVRKFNLIDVKEGLLPGNNLYIMLPSALFGFKATKNDNGLKDDILKANIFSESEDGLISNISDLKFFFQPSLNLASWMNYSTYNSIAEHFNDFDGDVYVYPEHFLLPEGINSIYIAEHSFICSFEDLTGFSGFNDLLEDYLQILLSDGLDLKTLQVLGESEPVFLSKFKDLNFKKIQLSDIHINFINSLKFSNVNFFKRKLSFQYIKQKLKFNFFEFWAFNISALIFLIAPLVISYNLNSSVNTYKQSTEKIFEQLNPNFKRLVNARAQIDDLTRNIPKQNNISKQDLSVLKYLDAFRDDSIQKIAINLKEQEINIHLEGLPLFKLNLLKQILKSEDLNFIESDLIEKDDGFFGNLLVQYET